MLRRTCIVLMAALVATGMGVAALAADTGAPKAAAKDAKAKAPAKPKPPEEPNDGIMGAYVGAFAPAAGGAAAKAEAKVIGEGGGAFRVVLVAGEGDKALKAELTGKADGKKVAIDGGGWKGTIDGGQTLVAESKDGKVDLKYTLLKSPTEGAKPPAGAVILLPFEPGKAPSLDEWTNATWIANPDGSMMKGTGDNRTKKEFADLQLHIEFMCPYMPAARGQARGNSGVYLMDRYEVQVLDSYGLPPKDNEIGGLYKVSTPTSNASFPPLTWETYDITFHAPKLGADGKKSKPAAITVVLNGVTVQDNVEFPKPTGSSAGKPEVEKGPLRLQDHGNTVRFRNVWVKELK